MVGSVVRSTFPEAIRIGSVGVSRVSSAESSRIHLVNLEGQQDPPELGPREWMPRLPERHREGEESVFLPLFGYG